MRVHVDAYATEGPGDVAGLERILSELPTGDIARLALVAKTEGTATINDFSRELALSAAARTIERIGGEHLLDASSLIFSTGSEGVLSPVVYVLAAIGEDDGGGDRERLVIGGGRTRAMTADELVTATHTRLIAGAVGEAMAEAGLAPDRVAGVVAAPADDDSTDDAPATAPRAPRRPRRGGTGRARVAGAAASPVDDDSADNAPTTLPPAPRRPRRGGAGRMLIAGVVAAPVAAAAAPVPVAVTPTLEPARVVAAAAPAPGPRAGDTATTAAPVSEGITAMAIQAFAPPMEGFRRGRDFREASIQIQMSSKRRRFSGS